MKILRVGVLFMLIGAISSCGGDESMPDFIGESVGNYSYTVKIFNGDKTVRDIISGNLTLSRNGNDITIIIDEIENMNSSRLELASNGFGFDIEAATLTDNDGNLINRSGFTSFLVGGKSYHGRYNSGVKQLFINASYSYQDIQFSKFSFSAEVTATKQK